MDHGMTEAEHALGIKPKAPEHKGAEHMKRFSEAHAKGNHEGMSDALMAHAIAMQPSDHDGDETASE